MTPDKERGRTWTLVRVNPTNHLGHVLGSGWLLASPYVSRERLEQGLDSGDLAEVVDVREITNGDGPEREDARIALLRDKWDRLLETSAYLDPPEPGWMKVEISRMNCLDSLLRPDEAHTARWKDRMPPDSQEAEGTVLTGKCACGLEHSGPYNPGEHKCLCGATFTIAPPEVVEADEKKSNLDKCSLSQADREVVEAARDLLASQAGLQTVTDFDLAAEAEAALTRLLEPPYQDSIRDTGEG